MEHDSVPLQMDRYTSLQKAHPELGKTWVAYLPALSLLPVVLAPPLNHDVAANLDLTQRWIGGEALYSRLLTVDPPLIFGLNLLPAYVGKYTALGAILALQLCVLFYGAVIWWLTVRLRRHSEEGAIERHFLNVAPVLVLVGAGYDFGQREHLMVLGALPYLFLATRRVQGAQDSYRYVVAILAAVAFAIKPYFLCIPAFVELYLMFTLGWRLYMRDPVPWAMAAVWVIYVASIAILFPDYLHVMFPLIFNYYVVGGQTVWQTILVPRMGTALVLLVPLLWLAFRGKNVLSKILSLAAMGAAASALVQRRGWSYHIVPIELFGCVLAGTIASRWLDMRSSNHRQYSQSIAFGLSMLFVLFVISSGEAPWRELGYENAYDQTELQALLIQSAPDARVLVLSPGVWPIYPALNYAHSHQTLRALNLWVLQGVYRECLPDGRRYRDIGEMNWAERNLFETVAKDFAADPPKMVVIDRIAGIPWCGREFNLLEYFKRQPLFANIWSRYAFFAATSRLDLYKRVEGSIDITAR
jgi:hypothetical protein